MLFSLRVVQVEATEVHFNFRVFITYIHSFTNNTGNLSNRPDEQFYIICQKDTFNHD